MFVKVIHRKRKKPRDKKDLRQLINYLISPKIEPNKGKTSDFEKIDNTDVDFGEYQRLLGPPMGKNILSVFPVPVNEHYDYAHDICNQMFDFARDKAVEHKKTIPEDWYTQFIMSFHPNDRSRFSKDGEIVKTGNLKDPIGKLFFIADWYLTKIGLNGDHRVLYVAHADRKHWHVHAIIALPNSLTETKKGLLHLERRILRETAVACREEFQLTKPSPRLIARHPVLANFYSKTD